MRGSSAGVRIPTSSLPVRIRLARPLLGLLVGSGLGLSGAALQALLQNPLVEPSLVGASTGAALGGVLAFYYGLATAVPLLLPVSGIAGALVGTTLLFLLAGRDSTLTTLILAGVAINAVLSCLTQFAIVSSSLGLMPDILFWLLGSLMNRSLREVLLLLPFWGLGMGILLARGRELDALTLGDDVAHTMGVDVRRLRTLVIVGTALVVGTGVAVSGAIGFIGLVVPHLLRPFVGHQPRLLLPLSALGGAAMLLAATSSSSS